MPEFGIIIIVGWVATLLIAYAVGYYHGNREQGDWDDGF